MKKNKIKQAAVGIALSMSMLAGTVAVLPAPSAQAANSVTLYRIYTDSTHTAKQLEDQGIDVWNTQPIQLLKITNNKIRTSKPKSLWIGGTHAREIAPPEVMLSNIDYLLNGYGVDPDVTWMLDNREVYILPVLNPDGHVKTEQLLN